MVSGCMLLPVFIDTDGMSAQKAPMDVLHLVCALTLMKQWSVLLLCAIIFGSEDKLAFVVEGPAGVLCSLPPKGTIPDAVPM